MGISSRYRVVVANCILILSQTAWATSAPKLGEILGNFEYSLMAPVSSESNDFHYSEALRVGLANARGLPFGLSAEFGFLNQTKPRYAQLNLFNFGRHPMLSDASTVSPYYRVEALGLGWAEKGQVYYAFGAEVGFVLPISREQGIAFFSKAGFDGRSRKKEEDRWGQGDLPQPVIWLGASWVQVNRQLDGNGAPAREQP
ncbi:MAG: hypothetical protein KF802_06565 [Bdellovibrionaceae bacterium]|nr:hypothetical protein [Pseudobdellovibrionaceae bacterium]